MNNKGWTISVSEGQTELAGVVMRLGRQFGQRERLEESDCTQEAVLYALGFGVWDRKC